MSEFPEVIPDIRITVPEACDGLRLDQTLLACRGELAAGLGFSPSSASALCAWLPDGLRGWKRACGQGCVTVNGRPVSPAYKVRAGQTVSIVFHTHDEAFANSGEHPFLVAEAPEYAALYKPAGWHSAHLAGKGGSSLEQWLDSALPDAGARLVNRLDRQTSGLVICARSPAGVQGWKDAESSGLIRKYYFAVAEGVPQSALTMRQALDTANRARTRVLSTMAEAVRQTRAIPLLALDEQTRKALFGECGFEASLVLCLIRKGARHQIRAHLAHAGYPLVGDMTYGSRHKTGMLLHHALTDMPGFSPACLPGWFERLGELRSLMPELTAGGLASFFRGVE